MKKDKALTEFIATNKPRGKKGKLEPFKEEILFLESRGYTCSQIASFLKTQDVETVPQNVRHFLAQNKIDENVNNSEIKKIEGDKNGN